MVRPHNLRLDAAGEGPWRGRVAFHRSVGALVEYHVETEEGATLRVAAMRQSEVRPIFDDASVSIAVVDPALSAVYPG